MKRHRHQLRTRPLAWVITVGLVIVGSCGADITVSGDETLWVVGAKESEDTLEREADAAQREVDVVPRCEPDCVPGQCGDDGCGGSCGPCSVLTPFCLGGWCQADPPPKDPTLTVSPDLVDFGLVSIGDVAERTITLTNISKTTVEVSHFSIAGDGAFVVVQEAHRWRSPSGIEITVELQTPWQITPGDTREITVRYGPVAQAPGEATLRLLTNEPGTPDGHTVTLRGGPPVGCATWEPDTLDFGATVFGSSGNHAVLLQNCGTLDLTVKSLAIIGDNAGAFAFTGSAPATLSPGETWETTVTYTPTAGSVGALGALEVELTWEAQREVASLPLSGFVVVADCPVAQLAIAETSPVAPGTILHLSGETSYSPVSTVMGWSWSTDQPDGSIGTFYPDPFSEKTTFEALVVGLYHFDLAVEDALGETSCAPASVYHRVEAEPSVYVELTWHTPGDPDPSDQGVAVGVDMDLHLAHPGATGHDLDADGEPEPWFDTQFDCYWFNPDPNWGPFSPPTDDDPHLTIVDIDGSGPEAIGFDLPEVDKTYRVAVHVWSDHGFGPSQATVRIFVLGNQVFESNVVTLNHQDLWEVADIEWLGWPNAHVTPLTSAKGVPIVFPNASP